MDRLAMIEALHEVPLGDMAPVVVRMPNGDTWRVREVYAHGGKVTIEVEQPGPVRKPLGPIRLAK